MSAWTIPTEPSYPSLPTEIVPIGPKLRDTVRYCIPTVAISVLLSSMLAFEQELLQYSKVLCWDYFIGLLRY